MEEMTVDEFVQARVSPELQPVVAKIRALMKECAPRAEELVSYGLPCYRGKRVFALFSPNKRDITFSFTRGVQFEDKYQLLSGHGVSARNVKIKTLAEVNEDALRYYIRQALEFDAK
jgi:hypothetical protein